MVAIAEIRTTQQHIRDQPDPDLLSVLRLARHRDRIHDRSNAIPADLPTVIALLGQHDRAETIAHSYRDLTDQAYVLTSIAAVVAHTDPDRAARLTNRVEALADALTNRTDQAYALTRLVAALAPTDPDRAAQLTNRVETLAHTLPLTGADERAYILITLVAAVARTDPDRAEALADTLTNPADQADALIRLGSVAKW